MKILIYVYANKESGLGHWYRMKALASELIAQKHEVWVASDFAGSFMSAFYLPIKPDDEAGWFFALAQSRPDWIIVDVPGEAPPYVYNTSKRLCLIDGIGHPASEADLVISQGKGEEYCAPDYLLLRQDLRHFMASPTAQADFVFGGAADPMNIAGVYSNLYLPKISFVVSPNGSNSLKVKDESIFGFMALSNRAIVATGMILWELAYLGLPTYAFSRSERHLETALWLDELGLVRAYPNVGIPDCETFAEFIGQSFEPSGKRPDLDGAKRVVRLLEAEAKKVIK